MTLDGQSQEPLGLPRGSVRSLMSLGVVLAAGAIAGFLLAGGSPGGLTKMGVGGGREPPGDRGRVRGRSGAFRRVDVVSGGGEGGTLCSARPTRASGRAGRSVHRTADAER